MDKNLIELIIDHFSRDTILDLVMCELQEGANFHGNFEYGIFECCRAFIRDESDMNEKLYRLVFTGTDDFAIGRTYTSLVELLTFYFTIGKICPFELQGSFGFENDN